jgi:hypothetical protein
MRSSAATDEYARAETDPLCHFRNHRSAAPMIKLRGPHSRFQPDRAGGRVHREKVSSGTAEARTRPSSTPRLAPGRPTRCDTSYRGQRTYSSADERAFDPMHESAVFAWSSVHDRGWSALSRGRRLPTGDGRSSSHVGVPDGYEHHRKQHSLPAAPRRALLLVLVFCPNDAATASMQRAIPCTRSGQARRWVRSDQLVREDRHAEEDHGVAGSEVAVGPAQKTPLISASRVLPSGRARWWALWVTPNSARRRLARAGGSPARPLLGGGAADRGGD